MAVNPSSRRLVAGSDPVASPGRSGAHGGQLDLRLNGIKGKAAAASLPTSRKAAAMTATTSSNAAAAGGATSRKNFAADARFVGQLLTDAIRHSDLTPQEAAFAMGYADQSALSRWMSGADVPQMLLRWLSLPQLRRGLLIAIARADGNHVRVETVVTLAHGDREATA